jgi:hypothetical protein
LATLERGPTVFRTTARDRWVVLGATLYAAVVGGALRAGATPALPAPARVASIVLVAVGLCWCANTVSHIQLHTPIFRARAANRAFTLTLTLLLGIPQTGWRRRHLRHHALPEDKETRPRATALGEAALLLGAWALLAWVSPWSFLGTYLPAWLLGLGFCATQGHYEHHHGAVLGVDYHGRRYNRWWFNDGYHVRHHQQPTAHWTTLPSPAAEGTPVSAWPPLLRWLGDAELSARGSRRVVAGALDWLEARTLAWRPVRWFMLRTHRRALENILASLPGSRPRRVCIVGGGLFPRTALLLRRLLPEAHLTIVDADAGHLRTAARLLRDDGADAAAVTLVHDRYQDGWSLADDEPSFDLLVVPLAFRGERDRLYRAPRAAHVLVHDWLWRRRGAGGRVVSPWLLKRINWVSRAHFYPQRLDKLDTLAASVAPENPKWSQPCRTIVSPPCLPPPPVRRPALASASTWRQGFARVIGRPS